MRCGRCGNENDEGNRFCGMCGTALVAKAQAVGKTPLSGTTGLGGRGAERVPATRASSTGAASAGAASVGAASAGAASVGAASAGSSSRDRSDAGASWPVISGGPSLLGLNLPAPETGRDALRPSSNVDYLLDDVEEPRRSRGKVILIVAALGLAVGFGYLHWARGGFDWLKAGDKKPTAAATDAGPGGADSGGATAAGGTAPQGGGAGMSPAASPAESVAPQAASPQTASQGTPSQDAPGENIAGQNTIQQNTIAQNNAAPNNAAPNNAGQYSAAPAATPESGEQQSAAPGNARDSDAGAEAGGRGGNAESEKESAPAEAPRRAAARKPSPVKPAAAKPVAPTPVDSVIEAERYIYGRGVAQDCDHGLRLLKPAAAQSNVKAMISLGTLYSIGTCTPRDLPTAYRWFALALHKEPDNQALQNYLQNLWGKMTQPERQLAIKLSR